MRKRLTKDQIFTIPNMLTVIRIMLIPLVVYLYVGPEERGWAANVIFISAVTDVADGWIARHYNSVSDLGKFIDPVADKLLQAAVMICVWSCFPNMIYLICLFAVKEIYMLIWGIVLFRKKDSVSYALWHGKLNTTILLSLLGLMFLRPDTFSYVVGAGISIGDIFMMICGASVIFSSVMYTLAYIKRLRQ